MGDMFVFSAYKNCQTNYIFDTKSEIANKQYSYFGKY